MPAGLGVGVSGSAPRASLATLRMVCGAEKMEQHEAFGLMLHRLFSYPTGKSEAGVKLRAGFLNLPHEHLEYGRFKKPETKRTAAEVC